MKQPHLTLGQIREYSAPKSFERGQKLYFTEAISDTCLRGNVIEGICEASSQSEPYQVEITLGDKGIVGTACNCSYELGGYCKHIIALLLTYLNKPEQFAPRAQLEDNLESRDKAELITLIQQMIKKHPDLKTLIDRPIPGKQNPDKPFDVSVYRRELRHELKREREWGSTGAEGTVESIAEAAQAFSSRGDWHSASTIYRMIIDEALAHTDYFYEDEEGEYGYAIDQVVGEIGKCLEQLKDDDSERKALLDRLTSLFLKDSDAAGDTGADAPKLILRHAKVEDIADIRSQVMAEHKKAAGERYGDWRRKTFSRFLSDLDLLNTVDVEVVLARLRDEGEYGILVDKLVELKRIDEAVTVIQEHIIYEHQRLQQLVRLSTAGYRDAAIQVAEKTLAQEYNSEFAGWLIFTLKTQNDPEKLFYWQFEQFKNEPLLEYYSALKTTALQLGNWLSVQPTLIAQLEAAKKYALLTRAYLFEEEWDRAWATLPQALKTRSEYFDDHYRLELDVAEATLETHPEKSLPVLIRAAQKKIDERNRESYRVATAYLEKVRDTYDSMDEYEKWEALIARIRRDFPKLTALQSELNKAGL